MKNGIKYTFAALVLLSVMASSAFAATTSVKELDPDPKISRQQMSAQTSFFNEALVHFTAPSPDWAVELWVKGDQTRNGVYKYAVACDELKQRLISEWGLPEKSFWIIGGSSPWLTGHEIVSKTYLSPTEIRYVVEYQWTTSAGPEPPSTEQLFLERTQDGWCVTRFIQSDGYHSM